MQPTKVVFRRRRFKDMADAWWWFQGHPMFEYQLKPREKYWRGSVFPGALVIEYHNVNDLGRIDDNPKRNIFVACWLECGPHFYHKEIDRHETSHDPRLDVGGWTFEEAFMKLVKKVLKHYGDYDVLPYSKTFLRELDRFTKRILKGAKSGTNGGS